MTNDVSKGDRLAVTALLGFISLVGCVLERPSPLAEEADAGITVKAATEPSDAGKKQEKDAPPTEESDGGKAEPCGASFIKDVIPALDAAGCGATACHGTRFGPAVRIEVRDIDLTYDELTAYKIAEKPYVKVGSTDLEVSAIHCHLAGRCGVKMPPTGGAVPPKLIQAVDKWLACGAPKN